MNQLRLDPLSGRWVVVSPGRSERPYSFVTRTPWMPEALDRPCPFCPGNEEDTPPALETYGPTGRWLVRVVPNLYPAFEGDEPFVVANRGPVFTQASAGGIHEILIFSPEHDATLGQLSQEQVELVMAALRDRLEEHASQPNLRYTQAIVNSGREAGASLEHPHGQLLGMSFIPRELAEEQARFARFVGSCLLCTTIEAEEDSDRTGRSTPTTGSWWSAPSGAPSPTKCWSCPGSTTRICTAARPRTWSPSGEAIRRSLQQLAESVGDVAYNIVFHSAPYRVGEPYHWHAHIWPKATTTAGFELGTGVAINVISPEEAAETLKVSAGLGRPAPGRRRPAPSGPAPGTTPAAATRSRSGPTSPPMPGVPRYPVTKARRFRISQAWPSAASPSRPVGSRSAAATGWPGASTTAGRPRHPAGCAGAGGRGRPTHAAGAQSLTTHP